MKRSARYLTGIVALLAASSAHAKELPNYNAYYDAKPVSSLVTPGARLLTGGRVASMDEQRGVPSFFWAPAQPLSLSSSLTAQHSPEKAARAHLARYAPMYGVSTAALDTAVTTRVLDTGRGGVVVTLRQELNGVEIFHGDVKVLMRQDLELVALSGSLHPSLVPTMKRSARSFGIPAGEALSLALSDLYGKKLPQASVMDLKRTEARHEYFDLRATPEVKALNLRLLEPARVKKVYFPLPDRLVPAYFVEFIGGNAASANADAYDYVIAADDGRVLYRVNLTHHDAFNYRVWADPANTGGRPFDGPIADFTPHPTGVPDGSYPAYVTQPPLIAMDGFNKNPSGVGDPWLPTGATETKGNNVDAYTDIKAPDGFSAGDFRADITSPGTFDRIYNLSLDPLANQNQGKAATVQIFYVTNWLHDWWYDSGFNEAAGNAQQDNYGRGGIGGDPLFAEAEDDANNESNNANMQAMSDGASPRMQMYVWDGTKPGVRLDGTIDNTVVAHEWGHYIHLREVSSCGNQACGAESEGWGDFNALHMILRSTDNLDGVYPLAIYATPGIVSPNAGYFGIRRAPYSVDFNKNAFTFKHIQNGVALPTTHPVLKFGTNAEVHNAGEIWTTMLFEAYVALLKTSKGANPAHTFEEARRLMSDYVVAGLQLAPNDPTYTEQRDAILAAAAAKDKADFAVLANAFAKRGAGTCAKSPPRTSTTFSGLVESFTLSPEVALVSLKLDDSVKSCDNDGILDAGETGKLIIEVRNTGTGPLTSTSATVTSTFAGVSFPNGAKVNFGTIQPFDKGTATVDVALADTVAGISNLDFNVTIDEPAACTKTQKSDNVTAINYDDVPNSSSTDNVESTTPVWTAASIGGPPNVWSRQAKTPTNHVWYGVDFGSIADSTLESPPLDVAPTGNFVISFTHRYHFETSQQTFWDGAVIEVSQDNGATWVDIGSFSKPPYNGVITNQASNPLANRKALVGQNTAWPNTQPVTINAGTSFAGKTIKVRFRIGSDEVQDDFGWEIDDISFQGITNKPFSTIVPNTALCEGLPVANAGPDQVVTSGDLVILDASGSSDPQSDPLTYTWTEVSGPSVVLNDTASVQPKFTAPTVTTETIMTFQVEVSDGKGSSKDTVDIKVQPSSTTTTSSVSSSASGSGGSTASSSGVGGGGMGGAGAGGSGAGGAGSTSTSTTSTSTTSTSGAGTGGAGSTSTSASTSSTAGAGGAGTGGEGGGTSTGGDPNGDPGCGCSTVGNQAPTSFAPFLAFAAFFARRRRRNQA